MEAGKFSVAFPRRWWYPVGRSRDVGRRPLGMTLMDTPLVVFRDRDGRPAVLLDRCAHRNYPLSLGRIADDGALECGYHGWCYDRDGSCVRVPGLVHGAAASAGARGVPAYPTEERDGFVWVWADRGSEPTGPPFGLPAVDGPNPGEVVFQCDLDCTLHAALENSLDVPHTAFLHRGIFRGAEAHTVTAVRRALDGGVEAQYLGEPVGMGPVRLGDGGGRTFDHWDRFFLPSTAQIEYAVQGWFRLVNTILHLPLSPFRTRAWFVVRFWSRLPAAVVKPIVALRGNQILRQDARALAHQTERIRGLGGERFASSDLDILGNAIWRLLRQAERAEQPGSDGEADDGPPLGRSIAFEV